MLKHLKHSFRR